MMKKLFAAIVALLFVQVTCDAQMVADPTTWSQKIKKVKDGTYELTVDLKLKPHWHIWSLEPGGDGSMIAPSVELDKNPAIKLVGKLSESGKKQTKEFSGIDGLLNFFENAVSYKQTFNVSKNTKVNGTIRYQVCDYKGCLPPKDKKFSIDITDAVATIDTAKAEPTTAKTDTPKQNPVATVPATDTTPTSPSVATEGDVQPASTPAKGDRSSEIAEANKTSLIATWATGFGWGLASVITPCVFAMLPMTIGFFLKRSKSKAVGRKNAIIYAFSIIAILTAIGALISVIGGNSLNNLATHWVTNLFFFIVFLIFGVSFLGAFEINLPSWMSTATDSKANTNSIVGIFFMALTLVIVSFSCTGPFIGNMAVQSISSGKIGPLVGFNGFAVGLALPFAATALFPSLLDKASQGGWLNAVKVTFGVVELALALKFLSNADLAMQWRLLDREIP
jgi:thiol:disulfide interchange protein